MKESQEYPGGFAEFTADEYEGDLPESLEAIAQKEQAPSSASDYSDADDVSAETWAKCECADLEAEVNELWANKGLGCRL